MNIEHLNRLADFMAIGGGIVVLLWILAMFWIYHEVKPFKPIDSQCQPSDQDAR